MNDQPQFIFKADADSFAEAPQIRDFPAFDTRDRWRRGPQQKWRDDLNAPEFVSPNSAVERFQVDGDIRKFRHSGAD
jgi:hypothetical protein